MTTINVTEIVNVQALDENGDPFSDFIRLTLASPPPSDLDIESIFFGAGSTVTTIQGTNPVFPWNPGVLPTPRKVTLQNGRVVILGQAQYPFNLNILNVVEPGSLLAVLRNNRNPLRVKHVSSINPLGGELGNYIILGLRYNLTANSTKYINGTGNITALQVTPPLTIAGLIAEGFKQRFADSIYAMTPALDLAYSSSKDLGYRGQLKIANTLFDYMGYEDPDEFNLLFLTTDSQAEKNFIIRNTTKINPYKLPGFVERINDNSDSVDISEINTNILAPEEENPNQGRFIFFTRVRTDINGNVFATFQRRGLVLKIGTRMQINTLDYKDNFTLAPTKIDTNTAEAIVFFSEGTGGINTSNLLTTNSSRYVIGTAPDARIVDNVLAELTELQTSIDPFAEQVLSVSNLYPFKIFQSLEGLTRITPRPIEVRDDGVPPGTDNSRRANVELEITDSNYSAIRPIQNPFNPERYCTKFRPFEDCQEIVTQAELNYRSDALNRNPFATVDTLRYLGELPLGAGLTPSTEPRLLSDTYQEYWDTWQNKVPTGGCLSFLTSARPDFVNPCLAVQRCTRVFSTVNRNRVLSCVRNTIKGEENIRRGR